jgi:L-arabinokinase
MTRRVLFYVSGHGYGHARRCGQVIAALRALAPDVDVRVRTTAAARMFDGVLPAANVSPCDVDAGAAERSPLEVDAAGTLDRIAATLARRDAVVAAELPVLRELRPGLIVSDIPFLAGDVAAAADIPCVGLSNFTWDWIAERYVEAEAASPACAGRPDRRRVLGAMSDSYAKMQAVLRLPLGGVSAAFRQVIDVPLVANHARRGRDEVLRALAIDPADGRPRVLFGIRGAIPTETLAAAAREAPDLLFLCPTNEPGDVPPGVLPVPLGRPMASTGRTAGGGSPAAAVTLDFSDALQACDAVVGKMGYGLVAECIVSGVALVWPRRAGFREDEVTERDGPRVMRMRELPAADFRAGRWAEHLRAAVALPGPPEVMRADGAEVCAAWIAGTI